MLVVFKMGVWLVLVNKELLVVGGLLVLWVVWFGQIVLVDFEYFVLVQCLCGGIFDEVVKLVLMVLGGLFWGWFVVDFEYVIFEQVGVYFMWLMGLMNMLNLVLLVNKGFEVIEIYLLFGIFYDCIDVVVYFQLIIYLMVIFIDGLMIVQVSFLDMKLLILLVLGWLCWVSGVVVVCDFYIVLSWEFELLDIDVFFVVELVWQVGVVGGCMIVVYNVVNEEVVVVFFVGWIGFLVIVGIIVDVLYVVD